MRTIAHASCPSRTRCMTERSGARSTRSQSGRCEPARIRYLRRRPDAALTVDHYSDDWEELAWVQALGRVEVLALAGAPDALAALVAKYEPVPAGAAARPAAAALTVTLSVLAGGLIG